MQHDFLHRLLPSHLLSQFHMEKKRSFEGCSCLYASRTFFFPSVLFDFFFFLVSVFFFNASPVYYAITRTLLF